MSAKGRKQAEASQDAPGSPPQGIVVSFQDGSTEDLDAGGGLAAFAFSKEGKFQVRTQATRGALLVVARAVLRMLSEGHIATCDIIKAGNKCVEGTKFDAADLLLVELIAIGNIPPAAVTSPGASALPGARSPFN